MRWMLLTGLAAALVTLASPCEAALQLRMTVGATVVTVPDADNDGVISYDSTVSGAIGTFSVVINAGLSEPSTTSPYPHLHLHVGVTGVGTMKIELTETSDGSTFVSPLGSLSMGVGGFVGGGAGNTVTVSSFVDDSDAPFGTATPVNALGPLGPGVIGGTDIDDFSPVTNPYSVTMVAFVTHSSTTTSSFDADLSLPEPTTIAMWSAFSVVGLAVGGLRRRRAVK